METEEPGGGLTPLILEVVTGQGFGLHHTLLTADGISGPCSTGSLNGIPCIDWTPLTARLYSWGPHSGKGRGGLSFQI